MRLRRVRTGRGAVILLALLVPAWSLALAASVVALGAVTGIVVTWCASAAALVALIRRDLFATAPAPDPAPTAVAATTTVPTPAPAPARIVVADEEEPVRAPARGPARVPAVTV